MALRPAIAAFRCCGCRGAVSGAVLGRAAPISQGFGAPPPKRLPAAARTLSASRRRLGDGEAYAPTTDAVTVEAAKVEAVTVEAAKVEAVTAEVANLEAVAVEAAKVEAVTVEASKAQTSKVEDASAQPWFLEIEPPSQPSWKPHAAALPKAPGDAPPLLGPMIKYVYEDMGLDDLALLDLRDLDPPAGLGPRLMMVIATARSDRHLHISSGRFVRWLRRNGVVNARADGLIGPGELKTKLRRLRKKAKLMGTNSMVVPEGDHGLSTGWVCVTFTTGGGGSVEAESFDGSGRFSGFGVAQTGTTVVVQCMTESRRTELDLESLWQGQLRSSIERSKKILGEKSDGAELDALVSAKVQLPRPSIVTQLQTLRRGPSQQQQQQQQQRTFSTLARRLQADAGGHTAQAAPQPDVPEALTAQADAAEDDLAKLQRHVWDIQLRALPLDPATLESLLVSALRAASPRADTASERLTLVDELLLTGQERGLAIDSQEMLVTLIASMVTSPAFDTQMARAQGNLETLLLEKQCAPPEAQVLRLMEAYAHRRDWNQFLHAFRSPARFQAPRSARLYAAAYHLLAASRNRALCRDSLRWMYPDMLRERPPVLPVGRLFDLLKGCILVADPWAEHGESVTDPDNELASRRTMRREFRVMLRDAETLRLKGADGSGRP